MPPDKRILNAMKRSEVHRKEKRAKAQAKLKRRMEVSLSGSLFVSLYIDEASPRSVIYTPSTPPPYSSFAPLFGLFRVIVVMSRLFTMKLSCISLSLFLAPAYM